MQLILLAPHLEMNHKIWSHDQWLHLGGLCPCFGSILFPLATNIDLFTTNILALLFRTSPDSVNRLTEFVQESTLSSYGISHRARPGRKAA